MMRRTIYTLFLLFAATVASAQDINKIITKDYVDHLIKTLSSDEMQGRRTFTPGIDKAASFIESEFKQIGLKPLEGNSYRQTFYKYQLKPLSATVSIDGQAIDKDNILVLGNSAEQTAFDQSNSDGWIKLDPEKDFMNQYRSLMRAGKRQLVLVDVKFVSAFKNLKTAIANRTPTVDEKDLKNPKAPAMVMVLDKDTVAKEFKVELKNEVTKLPLFNVAGVIPGKSKAKELVIFSGHYDHMGIVKPKDGDSIMNGADDDASGTSAMIALAKYYKKLKNNERTLIFVAFTAEEIGGYGARYFSQQLNPDDVVAMFNIEMIGKDSKFGKNTAFITGYDKSDFGKILQKNLEGTEFTFHPDPYTSQNLFYRSDNATLAALGVPAHTISTDQIDIDKHYHQVSDEYSTLDVENILSTIRAIAKSAVSIVKGIDTPTRIPKLNP
ncbi:M20/M25/M40 family metallo-hydrolase [Pedobacter sp. KR3-3]|uniref:M20/M25/M40 family metallo-hydrolase n=1 Tax=Pedobacter albus TaxID=3113905 RepID=A0ABU7IA03_9SPHI|nr:M20/M25/M40 family metallo-hydrolase [Pedobacter sp. KR3-3]MEE1946323.1 M20/M25/M40 family metallo-hydrolase [Pedobacter sp. KR3-3]